MTGCHEQLSMLLVWTWLLLIFLWSELRIWHSWWSEELDASNTSSMLTPCVLIRSIMLHNLLIFIDCQWNWLFSTKSTLSIFFRFWWMTPSLSLQSCMTCPFSYIFANKHSMIKNAESKHPWTSFWILFDFIENKIGNACLIIDPPPKKKKKKKKCSRQFWVLKVSFAFHIRATAYFLLLLAKSLVQAWTWPSYNLARFFYCNLQGNPRIWATSLGIASYCLSLQFPH
jgi:hypothetical protein